MATTVTFASKTPHKTRWLEIEYDLATPPDALLADLKEIGWLDAAEDTRGIGAIPRLPPVEDRQLLYINPPAGSGFAGDWEPAEQRRFLRQVRAVLRRHGFVDVPHWKKQLTDLL